MNRILLLLNIPETITADDVRELVSRAGLRCTIPDITNHNETPVKFNTVGHVNKALVILNQLKWFDRDHTPVQAIHMGDRNGTPLHLPFNDDDRNNTNCGDDPAFAGRGDRNGPPFANCNDDDRNNNNRLGNPEFTGRGVDDRNNNNHLGDPAFTGNWGDRNGIFHFEEYR